MVSARPSGAGREVPRKNKPALVFDRCPEGGGEMLLALKLADNTHDDARELS